MRFFLSKQQRLFLRTELWRQGKPTSVADGLALGAGVTVAGLLLAAFHQYALDALVSSVGLVLLVGNVCFGIVFGTLRLQKDVYTRVSAFLEALTHATYSYDRTTFPMQIYHLIEQADGSLRVETDNPWWQGSGARLQDNPKEPTYPAPAWVSQAVDALTMVEGVRVLPATLRFTTFAERERPKPTMHQLFALRADVLARTPKGVEPVWT